MGPFKYLRYALNPQPSCGLYSTAKADGPDRSSDILGKQYGAYLSTARTHTIEVLGEAMTVDEYYCPSADQFMYHFQETGACEFLRPDGIPAPEERPMDERRFSGFTRFISDMDEVFQSGKILAADMKKEAAKTETKENDGADDKWPDDAGKAEQA